MARKQETKAYPVDDGEVSITITAMGGMDGTALGLRIGEILGPAIGTFVVALENKSPEGMGDAIRALFGKLTPAQFKSLAKDVLAGAQIQADGEFHDLTMDKINEVFSGNVFALYRLVFDAVRLNFSNFSLGLGISSENVSKLVAIAKSRAQKAMLDQETKTSQPASPPPVGA